MKKRITVTRDGTEYKITLDVDKDILLYDGQGIDDTRWTDFYVHETKSGECHFYRYDGTRWQGEHSTIEPISKEEFFDQCPADWYDKFIENNERGMHHAQNDKEAKPIILERRLVEKIIKMDVPEL